MLEWLERRLKSAYLRLLESECVRLRDENRQLVNSLLRHSGLDPVTPNSPAKETQPKAAPRLSWPAYQRKREAESSAAYLAQQQALLAKIKLREGEKNNA